MTPKRIDKVAKRVIKGYKAVMKRSLKALKWKPVLSFACLLASLFFAISLFDLKIARYVIGFAVACLGAFAQLFGDHYNNVKDFWFNKIFPQTHTFFIWSFVVLAIGSIVYFFGNYKLSFKLEKVGNE